MSLLGGPYLLGGAALLAFSAGWSVNDWRHDAALKSAADNARAEEQIKLDTLRHALNDANAERLSLAADLAREKTRIKIKYRTLTQEVPAHAPKNTETCNTDLSSGLIGLLNSAARGSARHSTTTTKSTGQRFGPLPDEIAGATD